MKRLLWSFAVALMAVATEAADVGDRFSQDFRAESQGQLEPAAFQLLGGDAPSRYCKLEPAGLRCTIPAGSSNVSLCGIDMRIVVRGDFDITAAYKILDLPKPEKGQGAGLKISIKDFRQEWASLQRLHLKSQGHVYSAHRAEMKGDSYRHSSEIKTTDAMSGRLRLKRSGTTLHYLVAEGDSEEFVELRKSEFPRGELVQVYFVAQSGGSPTTVSVIWTELDLRADELVRSHKAVRKPVMWTLVAAVAVGMLLAVGVGVLQWRRARSASLRPHKGAGGRKRM